MQREILACLHTSGVDVLEAHVYGVNHPSTDEVDAFVAAYVVVSRGAKKDFDDEKLEEMSHALGEVLDDDDAQVMFEPYDEDFSKDGAIEIQVMVQHHPDILHELTDALATMDLDVLRVDVTKTSQPAHGHTVLDASENKPPQASFVSRLSRANSFDWSSEGAGAPTAVSTVHAANLVKEARERASQGGDLYADGVEFFALEEKERAVFYAREADGTHQFKASRRAEIKASLEKIVHEHGLHGTILLRAVHDSEFKTAHQLPKFAHEDRIVVIKCTGPHHKDLLHEICDLLFTANLEVIHAEMDVNDRALEEHVFYVSRADDIAMDRTQRAELRASINDLCTRHGKESGKDAFTVSVLPLRGETQESVIERVTKEGRRPSVTLSPRVKTSTLSPPSSPSKDSAVSPSGTSPMREPGPVPVDSADTPERV